MLITPTTQSTLVALIFKRIPNTAVTITTMIPNHLLVTSPTFWFITISKNIAIIGNNKPFPYSSFTDAFAWE
jgi:hypothetical protein